MAAGTSVDQVEARWEIAKTPADREKKRVIKSQTLSPA
jgi:hypothetical protein